MSLVKNTFKINDLQRLLLRRHKQGLSKREKWSETR